MVLLALCRRHGLAAAHLRTISPAAVPKCKGSRTAALAEPRVPLPAPRRWTSSQAELGGPTPFDTHSLVCRLEGQKFTRGQAEAISGTILDVLRMTIRREREKAVGKVELEKTVLKMETMLQTNMSARKHDIETVGTRLREEIEKQASSQRLDVNLERSRAKEDLRTAEDRLLIELKRLEGMLVEQQQALLNVKNDLFKSLLAMVMSAGGIAIGVARIATSGQLTSASHQSSVAVGMPPGQ